MCGSCKSPDLVLFYVVVYFCKRLHFLSKKIAEPDFINVTAYIKLLESKTIVNTNNGLRLEVISMFMLLWEIFYQKVSVF